MSTPTRRPAASGWLAISTGFFGTRIAVAPVHGASLLGDDVVIAHDRHTITTAPPVDIVVTVDPADEQALDRPLRAPQHRPPGRHLTESST